MKKLIILSTLIACSSMSMAQLYVSAKGGYGLGMSPRSTSNENTDPSGTITTSKGPAIGMGAGLTGGLTLGYLFNQYMGVEVGAHYYGGALTVLEQTDPPSTASSSYTSEYKQSFKGMSIALSPAFVLKTDYDVVNVFTAMGPVVGLASAFQRELSLTHQQLTAPNTYKEQTVKQQTEYTGGLCFGVRGTIGLELLLTEKLALLADVTYMGLNYSPNKSVITRYEVDGKDQLASMTTRDKETEYVDSYSTMGNAQDPNAPRKSTPNSVMPFTNTAVNIGFRIYFAD